MRTRLLSTALLICLALLTLGAFSGCATTYPLVDQSSFAEAPAAPKKLAVVGFQSTMISGLRGFDSPVPISDMDEPYMRFLKDLSDTKLFTLISEETVASNLAYQNMPAPLLSAYNPAASRLSSAGKLHPVAPDIASVPQLAKALGADIVIFVRYDVGWELGLDKQSLSINFIRVTSRIKAVNSSGVVVWEDKFDTQSSSRRTAEGALSISEIQKLAVDTLGRSSGMLVTRFQAALAAR